MKTMWSLERPAGGMAASQGGQLTKRRKKRLPGGMAASRGGQPSNEPTGGKTASLRGHPSTAHGGATLPVMEEQDENCVTGRTPINGPGGGGGGGGGGQNACPGGADVKNASL